MILTEKSFKEVPLILGSEMEYFPVSVKKF